MPEWLPWWAWLGGLIVACVVVGFAACGVSVDIEREK